MLFSLANYSQTNNLVMNPSFEEKDSCPNWDAGIYLNFCNNWNSPNWNTPDYYHSCAFCYSCSPEDWYFSSVPKNYFGFQIPKTGYAYAGYYLQFVASATEYIQGKLNKTLDSNQYYILRFNVSTADNVETYCIDNIGAYFSDTMLHSTTNPYLLPVIPCMDVLRQHLDTAL